VLPSELVLPLARALARVSGLASGLARASVRVLPLARASGLVLPLVRASELARASARASAREIFFESFFLKTATNADLMKNYHLLSL
jgi:hypothetical protein